MIFGFNKCCFWILVWWIVVLKWGLFFKEFKIFIFVFVRVVLKKESSILVLVVKFDFVWEICVNFLLLKLVVWGIKVYVLMWFIWI